VITTETVLSGAGWKRHRGREGRLTDPRLRIGRTDRTTHKPPKRSRTVIFPVEL
jgi:hypothetical protein